MGLAPIGLVAASAVVDAAPQSEREATAAEIPALLPTTVTLPAVTLPPVTLPPVTVPPVTVGATVAVTVAPVTVAATVGVTVAPPAVTVPSTLTVPSGTAVVDVDLCVAAGLGGEALAQCQANGGGNSTIELELCAAAGLIGDALAQCQGGGGGSVAHIDLCAAVGLTGDALAQCQADDGGDSLVNIDLCAAAGAAGETSAQCAGGGDGSGSLVDVDLCVAAGLTGDALAQCQAADGGGGGGGSTVLIELCVAAGLSGDALAQCQAGDGATVAELCVAVGLSGDALAQCQAGGAGSGSTISIELCVAAGLTGDALAQCQAGNGPPIAELCVAAGFTGDALAQCQADDGDDTTVEIELCAAAGLTGDELTQCQAGPDLRQAGVFVMSNDSEGNEVRAYFRAGDGTLTLSGTFATDGSGSGGFEDSAHGLVLGSAMGETGPTRLTDETSLLFATNAGSDDISVFRVNAGGLELVDVEPSNGAKPVSVTVNNGVVYALNSDEETDGSADLRNCQEGANPSITGFLIDDAGDLTPIPDSTRALSGGMDSGCAQVSFNPTGTVLVVTQRTAALADQEGGDRGSIDTFVVNDDGTLGAQQTFDATGEGPLGFTFTRDGALLTAEQFGGPFGSMLGAAAGYQVNDDGTLTPSGASVGNEGTGTGWIVVSEDGTVAFASSFFGDGRISSYAVSPDGSLELLQADADPDVQAGASDLSLSGDSQYLYQLNSLEGTIGVFEVGPDGTLTRIGAEQAFDPSRTAAPFGLAAT